MKLNDILTTVNYILEDYNIQKQSSTSKRSEKVKRYVDILKNWMSDYRKRQFCRWAIGLHNVRSTEPIEAEGSPTLNE
jgi:hypothetical protein